MLKPFDYYSPRTLDDLFDILDEENVVVFTGGTELFTRIRKGLSHPKIVVDLKRIDELWFFSFDRGKGLTIGATLTLSEVIESPVVKKLYPILFKCCLAIGTPELRNKATVVGNICSGFLTADTIPVLLLYNCSLEILGRCGRRSISLSDFLSLSERLKKGEIVASIFIPCLEVAKGNYYRFKEGLKRPSFGVAYVKFDNSLKISICDEFLGFWLLRSLEELGLFLKKYSAKIDERKVLLLERVLKELS